MALLLAACATPTPSPSLTAMPTEGSVAPVVPDGEWTRIDPSGFAGFFIDVATTPSGLVIAGWGGEAGEIALSWDSPDGVTWQVDQLPGDGRVPGMLVPWGDKVVAVGLGQSDRCAHPAALDTWLRGADGAWEEAPWNPIFCAGGTPSAAAALDHILVAGTGTGDVPYLWVSDDGLRWTDISLPRDLGAPRAVASNGGTDVLMGSNLDGGVWVSISPNGTTWSIPAAVAAPPDADVMAVLPLDGGFVAMVRDSSGAVGAYRSDDGVTWEAAEAVGLDANKVFRLVAVEGALVALGGDELGRPAMWVSADGTSWRAAAVPDDMGKNATLRGIAVRQGRVFVVGQAEVDLEAIASAWAGPAGLIAP